MGPPRGMRGGFPAYLRLFPLRTHAATLKLMILRAAAGAALVLVCLTSAAIAQATLEGRVELPKTKSAPVMTKRYEVVTKGGVLATNPPLAIVYLEGSATHPASLPRKQVA